MGFLAGKSLLPRFALIFFSATVRLRHTSPWDDSQLIKYLRSMHQTKKKRRKMKRFLIVIAVCGILSGCGFYHGPVHDLPPITESESSELTIIRLRGWKSSAVPFHVDIDGTTIYALESGAYKTFTLNVGSHAITIWMREEEKWRTENTSNQIELNLKPGDKKYYITRTNHNPWTTWSLMEEVTQQEAEKLIQTLKPATPGTNPLDPDVNYSKK
jgi:hypothetical protein